MKLYYSPGTCSLSPHIVLQETGLPHELVLTSIRSRKLADGSDFLAINPLGYVPLLELDDGTRLTEGPAIVQYLADQAPDKQLAPANGTLARYQLQSWLNYISTELHKGFSPLFNPAMPEEAKRLAVERLGSRLQHINDTLANKPYLMGEQFTVADVYLFVVSNWAEPTKIDLSPYPHLQAFRSRVAARPAVQAAMKAEKLI
ncbi:MAG: glutathione transferase GstA [Brachymonas sp.]|nr:glutathione transferase GstA [Brachymonas sp.]